MAVTLEGLPLGLAAIKFWTRSKFKGTAALKKKVNLTRLPIEKKGSFRWLQNMRESGRGSGILSDLVLKEIPLRSTARAEPVDAALAMPRDARSLDELELIVVNLKRRENRSVVLRRVAEAAGLELAPDAVWLLMQSGNAGSIEHGCIVGPRPETTRPGVGRGKRGRRARTDAKRYGDISENR